MIDENKIYILENEKNKDYLKNYSFYIPNYQRGYKWSKENIEDLLNDINSIGKDGKAEHCLHNLTIINNEDKGQYEVVDGQQRLTTIYLLLNYLNSEEIYNLDYQIREETKHFINKKLKEIIEKIHNDNSSIDIFNSVKEEEIDIKKEDGTDEESSYNKQDIYFICDALFCMHQWFNPKNNNHQNFENSENLEEKIKNNLKNVYFYKHEITGIKGETVFANLNSGKVALTDIELIKADLIINISENIEKENKEKNNDVLLNEIRSNIGRLWDEMESFLAQDEVWHWIAANNKSANKLSLLFNLIGIEFFKDYENKKNNKTSNDILDEIKDYYYTIKDWYYDNDMYHLVGIAINIDIKIDKLFEIKENIAKNKCELKSEIIQSIINKLSLKIDDNDSIKSIKIGETQYEDLNYQNRKYIEKIMLLLNCLEGYNFNNKTFNKGFRYRFDLHNKENWSIEHIFPQNATKENYKSYILDLIFLFKEENKKEENKKEENKKEELKKICGILGIVNNNENIEELKKLIIEKLREFINENKDIDINKIKEISDNMQFMDIQSIGNLALLSKNINSSLKNDIFEEKRNKLLKKLSEENIFIPPLTLKIFSKNFDGAERTKAYWTPTDFNAYINYQEKQLKKIFKIIED